MKTKNKSRVEIFSAGKWNGDTYTEADLDEMVKAFDETSAGWKPPLKLGHNDEQQLLQTDGLPAAGYVNKLYRIGKKLFADFVDIPEKIYNLLEGGAYRKVSAEVFWDIDIGDDKTYSRMLAGVALLGADMPAVMNLSEILAWYSKAKSEKKFYANSENQPSIKTYEFLDGGEDMEKTPAQLQAEKKLADDAAELATLRQYKADQEKVAKKTDEEIAELKEQNRQADLDRAVDDLDLPPGAKPYAKALLDTATEISSKKEYSIKVKSGKGDKAKSEIKKYASRADILLSLLKVQAEALKLNTNEDSIEGEEIEQDGGDEAARDKKIRDYMKVHKCSYGNAMKAVLADEGPEVEEDEEDEE